MGDTSHRLTVAVEDEFERLKASDSQYFGATDQRRTRETASMVAEWRGRFGEAIDISAAVCHDDSNRFGSATTLNADAAWKLGHGLTIPRGYGEGFAPPTFFDPSGVFPCMFLGNSHLKAHGRCY